MARAPGKLIVFEGPDGVGKTTVSKAIARALGDIGIEVLWQSFPGREAGTLGNLVYDIHHQSESFSLGEIHPASRQLLHIAAHVDAIERVIRPALLKGIWVVLDRFWWSTFVYGIVAGADPGSLQQMIDVELRHWRGVEPHAVLLLDRDENRAHARDDRHAELTTQYAHLAEKQSQMVRVERLKNHGSLESAVTAAMSLLGSTAASSGKNPSKQNAAIRPQTATADFPLTWVKFAPMKPTVVFDTYWRFAAERQAVFFRRLREPGPPWTDDPILQEYKFTNAYRASDRVSQYLIRNVIYSGDQTADEVFFRTLLFKVFNRVQTWELLKRRLGEVAYREYAFEKYDRILTKAIDSGQRIYSAAYIMPSGGSTAGAPSGRKHRMHLRLIDTMLREELPARLAEAKSMGRAFDALRSYPTIGDFLAYQFVTDVNYSSLTDFSEMQFVVPGPGARDGLRKCFSDLGGLNEPEAIRYVTEHQDEHFARLGLSFQNLWGRKLQLIDCQNLFCEVDKYSRVKHPEVTGITGRTRIKQRYRPSTEPVAFWYPPKWGINDVIGKEAANVSQLLWSNGQ